MYTQLLRVMREVVGDREVTAQEGALDGEGLPLAEYSRQCLYIQARPPSETMLTAKRTKDRKSTGGGGAMKLSEYLYEPSVTRYINSMWFFLIFILNR